MSKKGSYHFHRDEVKYGIIECILKNNNSVSEPDILKHFKKKYGEINQSNINRHVHGLKDLGCIELSPPITKSRSNFWDITKIEQLKKIQGYFPEIKLNKFEKSINTVLMEFGYSNKNTDYIYYFIQLYMSTSFFDTCLETNMKLLTSKALEIYRYGAGFEDESRIEDLLNKCNTKYIKGKLNLKISEEAFRNIMEELSLDKKRLFEEYAYLICGCNTEQTRENLRKASEGHTDNIIDATVFNLQYNEGFGQIDQKIWIESFLETFKEQVPEFSKESIETILETPNEYQDLYLKINELLSLIEKQKITFNNTHFNVLFEHFLSQDILTCRHDIDLIEEINFAKKIKKIEIEFEKSLEKHNYRSITDTVNHSIYCNYKIFSEFMIEHKMPSSVLDYFSDDWKVVLKELLILHKYPYLTKYISKNP